MNKLHISLFVAVAICLLNLPAYSQVYVTDFNTDRATVTNAPPNVLGLLPVGANYLRQNTTAGIYTVVQFGSFIAVFLLLKLLNSAERLKPFDDQAIISSPPEPDSLEVIPFPDFFEIPVKHRN